MWTQTDILQSSRMPLGEHSWLRSGSFDETSSFLQTEKDLALRWSRSASASDGFWFEINSVTLPRTYLYYAESRPALEHTRLTALDFDYVVHVPLDGWIELCTENRSVQRGSGGAVIVSPTDRLSLTTSDGCRRLALRISSQALTTHLATMLGDPPRERLVFAPDVDPSQACSRHLANAVHYATQEFERRDSVNGNDVVVTQFEQFLMTLLLMSQPNNYSAALSKCDNGVRPKDVKRAIDYIHANLDLAITLQDLVAASGVAGRTLYQHFQDFVGASPMGYVRKVRYERVRDELARLHGESSVTEVAGRWGFTHMGRFSAEYRRRFGELPSVTARKRRPPQG